MRIKRSSAVPATIAAGALFMFVGCATKPEPSAAGPGGARVSSTAQCPMHADCLVCKKNADLACIDVEVDAKTPFADYNGKRYYFCSDECRAEFLKSPAKYANVK